MEKSALLSDKPDIAASDRDASEMEKVTDAGRNDSLDVMAGRLTTEVADVPSPASLVDLDEDEELGIYIIYTMGYNIQLRNIIYNYNYMIYNYNNNYLFYT